MGSDSSKQVEVKHPEERSELTESIRGVRQQQLVDEKARKKHQSRSRNTKIEQYPYNCIGLLTWKSSHANFSQEFGTAFLVAPTLLVTALHNAYDNFKIQHKSMKFYPKLNSARIQADYVNVIQVRSSMEKGEKIPINEEYCLLLLQKPIKRENYITLGYNYSLKENSNAEIFGYPVDLIQMERKDYQFGAKGRIVQILAESISYEIDTAQGQSGAPLIVETINHQKITVGIHAKSTSQKGFSCQLTIEKLGKIALWAKELTNQKSSIKMVNAQALKYEINPFSEQQRKGQGYIYIPLFYEMFNQVVKTQILPPTESKIRIRTQSSLDLWQTIKTGTFNIYRYPFNCIGLIICSYFDLKTKTKRKHYGTGFLINSTTVLTSINNLIKFEDAFIREYEDVTFYPGLHGELDDPENEGYSIANKRYNIPKVKPTLEKEIVETSLAVLQLEKPVKRRKYILIGEDYQERNKVYLFGYGWNKVNTTSTEEVTTFHQRGSEGTMIESNKDMIYHTAYSQNGSEGSPLLVEYIQGFFFIVGIHIRSKYEDSKSNCLALRMTSNRVKVLSQWVKALPKSSTITSYNLKEKDPLIDFKEVEPQTPNATLLFFQSQLSSSQPSHTKSEILINLAHTSSYVGKHEESNEYLMSQTSLSEGESFFKSNRANQIYYFTLMGVNNFYLSNYEKAADNFKQAEEIMINSIIQDSKISIANRGSDPRTRMILHCNLSAVFCKKKDLQEAEIYMRMVHEELKGRDSSFKVYNLVSSSNICCSYHQNGTYSNETFESKMNEAFNSLSAPKNSETLLVLAKIGYNLSIYYFRIANYRKAIEYLQTYLRVIHRLSLQGHKQHVSNLGWISLRIRAFLRSNNNCKEINLPIIKMMRNIYNFLPQDLSQDNKGLMNDAKELMDQLLDSIMPEDYITYQEPKQK